LIKVSGLATRRLTKPIMLRLRRRSAITAMGTAGFRSSAVVVSQVLVLFFD
jgi:hypothetical protein